MHSSTSIHPARSVLFVEDTVFSSVYISVLSQNSDVHMCVDSCLGIHLDSVDQCVCFFFLPISCCFYYNCFVVYLKLHGDAFSNYFIFQHCFNYIDFCYFVCFHMKLSIAVSGSVIICVGILIGIYIDSVD